MGETSVEQFSGDEPHFKDARLREGFAALACQPCGSKDTELIHYSGVGSIIGAWTEVEVRAEITEHES